MEASSTISKFFDADTARWFDLLIDGIVILDEKQRFVYANQAYRNHVHMDDETYAKYQCFKSIIYDSKEVCYL